MKTALLAIAFLLAAPGIFTSCKKDDPADDEQNQEQVQEEFVDLGLSVKWATCNVGANKPEDNGGYFAWGETTPKSVYDWSSYKHCHGSISKLTKYAVGTGVSDGKVTLEFEDDAAFVNCGAAWRMPTRSEWSELVNKCEWKWDSSKKGYTVTGSNGKSIFLPAAGYRGGKNGSGYVGERLSFWSSEIDPIDSPCAFEATSGNSIGISERERCFGNTVRPVRR